MRCASRVGLAPSTCRSDFTGRIPLMAPVGCLDRAAIALLVGAAIAGSCSAVMAQNDLRLMRIPDPLSGENPTLRLLPQEVPMPGVPAVDSHFGTLLGLDVAGKQGRPQPALRVCLGSAMYIEPGTKRGTGWAAA